VAIFAASLPVQLRYQHKFRTAATRPFEPG
jgi:hypothetical protein